MLFVTYNVTIYAGSTEGLQNGCMMNEFVRPATINRLFEWPHERYRFLKSVRGVV